MTPVAPTPATTTANTAAHAATPSAGPAVEVPEIPKWLLIARRYIGTHEVHGAGPDPIRGWATRLGGWIAKYYTADSIPWCGLFAGFTMEEAGYKTPGDSELSALSWASWGRHLDAPVLGCVLVFSRPGGHHVGYYEGEDDVAYHVTGGNQSNMVCTERILKAHCIARRWPAELAPFGHAVHLANNKPLSTNQA